jgi:hypothetical protein
MMPTANSAALIIVYVLAAWSWDFWPFTNGHFRPIDYKHDYNVNFQIRDQRKEFVGQVVGLDQRCLGLIYGAPAAAQDPAGWWASAYTPMPDIAAEERVAVEHPLRFLGYVTPRAVGKFIAHQSGVERSRPKVCNRLLAETVEPLGAV